jgi:ketosteroid isomerase-like protein
VLSVKEWQTMKTLMKLNLAVLVTAMLCSAAEPSAAVKEAVTKAEAAWKDAVIKGDRSSLEKLMADDLSYTHSSGKTQTKEEFIKEATGGALNYKGIDFEDTRMRQYGDAVVITHKATITSVQTGTSHLYLTEVWAKVHGQWQLATRHALKLP